MPDIVISTDKGLLQLGAIKRMLDVSYWAAGRDEEIIRVSIANSMCFGLYRNGEQIGFARAVTDGATMYYLCDLLIDERFRGEGLGKRLVEAIVGHEELRNLSGYLRTADAHGLYEAYGFERDADRFMARKRTGG
ncbi:GNAT family N-acetyltransferase [Saccharibacillus alkalitolerans]|uniref:GNAT family N-acetyltransferase n=1 Tax=Saccharibacillus alkalitolerans TaxID=2705290 RepID=A0ABX0FAI0_9BACL|nr:GNAT family N-acetyltransferase [Saccharibacillus alkalitolerans]NGZ76974.1 GNAT family N-acetyltransferase [Saccharibacillus alkalitolerans]